MSQRWFRTFRPGSFPGVRLVCFPHAGGGPTAFRAWPRWLPYDVELLAVCYPGRQDRIREPVPTTMDELVTGVVDALAPLLDRPTVLFGHSMGASVAFEVTRRLEVTRRDRPRQIFVSGRRPPGLTPADLPDLGDDTAVLDDVRRLGGIDPALLDEAAVHQVILPVLRADYRLLAGYRPSVTARIRTPIVAYVGDRDPDVTVDQMRAWSEATRSSFAARVFPGDHFYLVEQERALVTDLVGRLERADRADYASGYSTSRSTWSAS